MCWVIPGILGNAWPTLEAKNFSQILVPQNCGFQRYQWFHRTPVVLNVLRAFAGLRGYENYHGAGGPISKTSLRQWRPVINLQQCFWAGRTCFEVYKFAALEVLCGIMNKTGPRAPWSFQNARDPQNAGKAFMIYRRNEAGYDGTNGIAGIHCWVTEIFECQHQWHDNQAILTLTWFKINLKDFESKSENVRTVYNFSLISLYKTI